MNRYKLFVSLIESLLVILTLIEVFFFPVGVFVIILLGGNSKTIHKIAGSEIAHIFVFIRCFVLIFWVYKFNGVKSKLWNWLPPYVFFRGFGPYGRTVAVYIFVSGTLLGQTIGRYF